MDRYDFGNDYEATVILIGPAPNQDWEQIEPGHYRRAIVIDYPNIITDGDPILAAMHVHVDGDHNVQEVYATDSNGYVIGCRCVDEPDNTVTCRL